MYEGNCPSAMGKKREAQTAAVEIRKTIQRCSAFGAYKPEAKTEVRKRRIVTANKLAGDKASSANRDLDWLHDGWNPVKVAYMNKTKDRPSAASNIGAGKSLNLLNLFSNGASFLISTLSSRNAVNRKPANSPINPTNAGSEPEKDQDMQVLLLLSILT